MTKRVFQFLALPVLLAGSVAAAHLIPGIDGSEVERNIRDSLHIIGFAAVAGLIFILVPLGRAGKSLVAFAGAMVLGTLAEYGQLLAGFTFSQQDVVRDAIGAALMIVGLLLWTTTISHGFRAILRVFACMLVTGVFAPFAYWSTAFLSERMKAPVVMDFEGRFAHYYYAVANADMSLITEPGADPATGNHAIELTLTRAQRSGVLISTAMHNWGDFTWLVFDARIVSGNDSVVSVHLNDYDSIGHLVDTQSGMVTVSGDGSAYRVPLHEIIKEAGRSDDADDIRQVALFARSRHRGTVLRIDNLRLQ